MLQESGVEIPKLAFPDKRYKKTLTDVIAYFRKYSGVYAIVLTGSLARGMAVKGSCMDIAIFLEKSHFDALTCTAKSRTKDYSRLGWEISFHEGELEGGLLVKGIRVDLIFTNGSFETRRTNSFDITRDSLETTLGNLLVYCILLYKRGRRYITLKRKWLPFYDDQLRKIRLKGTEKELRFKIWKTRWLARRGEFFASLEALLEAQRILLQYLFIKNRVYPIDYTKWLRFQCEKILKMPGLYKDLAFVLDEIRLTEKSICERADFLEKLLQTPMQTQSRRS